MKIEVPEKLVLSVYGAWHRYGPVIISSCKEDGISLSNKEAIEVVLDYMLDGNYEAQLADLDDLIADYGFDGVVTRLSDVVHLN